jgi:hypothetical protein
MPFTLVTLTDEGHSTEVFYGTRHYAEKRFTALSRDPRVLGCYLYGTEVGGLVNAYHKPGVVS